jgi:hypothetical protein
MRNTKKIVVLLSLSSLTLTAFANWSTDWPGAAGATAYKKAMDNVSQIPRENPPMDKDWWFGAIMYFLKAKSSLSEVEKTAVEKIFSDYKAALKEINPDSKPVNLKSETFTKILELNTNLYASLKPYVDSSKATWYDTWVAQKLNELQWIKTSWTGSAMPWDMQKWPNDRKPNWPLFDFFKKPDALSADEQKSLKEFVDYYAKMIKGIVENPKYSETDKADMITAANKAFSEKIVAFIDPAKLDKFKSFVTDSWSKPLIAWPNGPDKKPSDNKKQAPDNKMKFLSQRTLDLFSAKLDEFPADRKEEIFNLLIKRIDTLLSKAKTDKTKWQLAELNDLIKSKLDELKNGTWEWDIISQVLDYNAANTGTWVSTTSWASATK